jgi:glycosyltransferase involved in cell wall biosynthesis
MNVLFIIEGSLSNPILFSQGIPQIQENFRKGVKYSILTFEDLNYFEQDPNAKKRFDEANSELKGFAQIFSVQTKKNKVIAILHLGTIRMIFRGMLEGLRIIKKTKVDIIHGRSNLPTLIALFLKKFSNVIVVYDNRGLVSDEFDNRKRLRIFAEKLIEKYLLKNSDEIIVVSKAFKKYVINKYPEYELSKKITVIANSFSEKRFTYSEQDRLKQRKHHKLEEKIVMVYSGPSVFWQRFDLVLTTFKLLKEMKKESFLLVVSYDPEIKKIILNSGIDKADFEVYNVMASEVGNYLTMGDFGVIFRDNRIRSKVCAPIKLGEYLASGLPVLCMNQIGDTDEIVSEYKVGVIMEDEKEIQNKLKEIVELINDPELRSRCRKTAEEKLSLNLSSQKYYAVYTHMK